MATLLFNCAFFKSETTTLTTVILCAITIRHSADTCIDVSFMPLKLESTFSVVPRAFGVVCTPFFHSHSLLRFAFFYLHVFSLSISSTVYCFRCFHLISLCQKCIACARLENPKRHRTVAFNSLQLFITTTAHLPHILYSTFSFSHLRKSFLKPLYMCTYNKCKHR